MEKDLVSIIVPVYNVEKYLNKCIDSIMNQTYKNLEILLVDDGSTDLSSKICNDYCKKDNRIKYLKQKNGGQSKARNYGLDVAKGKYICFIDSDDFVSTQMIECFVKLIKSGNYDVVFGKSIDYSNIEMLEKPFSFDVSNSTKYDKRKVSLLMNTTPFNRVYSKLFKRELFEKLRFPSGMIYEDSYIAPYLYDLVNSIIVSPYCYYYRYIREGSTVHSTFSKKDYDLITVGEDRIKFYQNKKSREGVILAYKFFMSNVINLYIKAYKSNILKEEKKDILDQYMNVYNISKSLFNIKDKLKYKSFIFFPNLIAKIYIIKRGG